MANTVKSDIFAMLCPRSATSHRVVLTILLLALPACLVTAQVPESQWFTVLAVKTTNGVVNIYDLLMSSDPLKDGPAKKTQNIMDIVAPGNFKSNLTEYWSTVQPSKIRVVLYDKYGSILWFTECTGSPGGKNPSQWMTIPSISRSTDRKLTASSEMTIVFDKTKLDIRSKNNIDGRLLLTWDTSSPAMYISTKQWSISPPPLSAQGTASSTAVMVLAQASINVSTPYSFSSGYTSWTMYLSSTHYLVGVGLRKNDSKPGEVQQFLLQVAVDPACWGSGTSSLFRTLCHPGTTNPIVFNATYKEGYDKSLAVVAFDIAVAAYCVKLTPHKETEHYTNIYLYETLRKSESASIFAIQWWVDPKPETTTLASSCKVVTVCDGTPSTDVTSKATTDVTSKATNDVTPMKESDKDKLRDEIVQGLTVNKLNTTKFKRQFISMPDHRPSAVVIGVLGISVISFVIFIIVILDFHTLSLHLKTMVSNCGHQPPAPAVVKDISIDWDLQGPHPQGTNQEGRDTSQV